MYRFYLGKIISFHTFYLPIAGGVVAYVLANAGIVGSVAAYGLLIPLVVSLGAVWIFFLALGEAQELNVAIRDSAKGLHIIATHSRILVHAVGAFLILHIVIVIGLAIGITLLFHGDLHVPSGCPQPR